MKRSEIVKKIERAENELAELNRKLESADNNLLKVVTEDCTSALATGLVNDRMVLHLWSNRNKEQLHLHSDKDGQWTDQAGNVVCGALTYKQNENRL